MARQLPAPTDLSGLSEEDRISLGERMYQMIMSQGVGEGQQPMGMQQQPTMQRRPPVQAPMQAPRRQARDAARTLMSRPPRRQPQIQAPMRRPMTQRQQARRLPPPQMMRRFAPQPPQMGMGQMSMMQPQPMMQGLYSPLGGGFRPQQAPLMAFNPYQGMM